MKPQEHVVTVKLANGKTFNKAYSNSTEEDIACHLYDYKMNGEKYGIKVLAVRHLDGGHCKEFKVA